MADGRQSVGRLPLEAQALRSRRRGARELGVGLLVAVLDHGQRHEARAELLAERNRLGQRLLTVLAAVEGNADPGRARAIGGRPAARRHRNGARRLRDQSRRRAAQHDPPDRAQVARAHDQRSRVLLDRDDGQPVGRPERRLCGQVPVGPSGQHLARRGPQLLTGPDALPERLVRGGAVPLVAVGHPDGKHVLSPRAGEQPGQLQGVFRLRPPLVSDDDGHRYSLPMRGGGVRVALSIRRRYAGPPRGPSGRSLRPLT